MSVDPYSALGLLALRRLHGGGRKKLLAALEVPDPLAGADQQLEQAADDVERAARLGVEVVSAFDPRFPQRLSEIPSGPLLLWVRGSLQATMVPELVAVVGTRQPSVFGQTAATALTEACASEGFGVVSGLALGVDTLGHQGALAAGVPTIAFLGCGLDAVYPRSNRELAEQIVESGGAVVSEQPFGEPASPRNLIARNRLQSGLSAVTIVVQTDIKGGTMHTARFAAEQGRPVFCPQPRGSHPKNAGIKVLLEQPASKLPEILPAFQGAKRLCAQLGEQPLARPVSRESVAEMLAVARSHAGA